MFVPAMLFLTGLAFPIGWIAAPEHDVLFSLISHPAARVVIFAIVSLSLFHWAHRFRFALYDGLQIKHLNHLVALFCYGSAIIGTVIALIVLVRL